jgi:hypothetical protein
MKLKKIGRQNQFFNLYHPSPPFTPVFPQKNQNLAQTWPGHKKPLTFLCKWFDYQAPLFLERCNYNPMIEYVTIKKLKG